MRPDFLERSRLVGLFGAAPDTGNLGVTALLHGTLDRLSHSLEGFAPVVFDYGRGVRKETFEASSGELAVIRCGAQHTKRLYRPEALSRIRASARFRGIGSPAARLLLQSTAVLDVSGGDSFTDLYGRWRFRAITLPKLITLDLGRPLFLLPQTYGPFSDPDRRAIAENIVRRATMAWARDHWSHKQLQELLGADFDPDRHREGVDVAFLMEKEKPSQLLPDHLSEWLNDRRRRLAGINVSGLLFNDSVKADKQYGLRANYRAVVAGLVTHLLAHTDWSLLLVPHVTTPEDHYESDAGASLKLIDALGHPDRVEVAPSFNDPRHVKWLISQLDWFCATRMHSGIAALSSGVPTAAIAYSPKTLGVFETCGQGQHVADPRRGTTDEVIDQLVLSWRQREGARAMLYDRLPAVLNRARSQMDELAAAIDGASDVIRGRA